MLENGQTYFKNLGMFTMQDFKTMFAHFPTLSMKALCSNCFKTTPQCIKKYKMQPAILLKVTLLHRCVSYILNCTNGTKSRKVSPSKLHNVFSGNRELCEENWALK